MSDAMQLEMPGQEHQGLEMRPARVLVADDSAANRHLLSLMLSERGYRVITAKNGQEAVTAFERLALDLILMDITMPVMDGFEATRLIKKRSGETYIPVMFITAASDEAVLAACLDAGGDDFLAKPVNQVILDARMSALLRIQRLYREQYSQRRELAYYQDKSQQEQEVAERIFSSIVHKRFLDSENIRYQLSPMSVFNGDVLLAARTPNGRTHLFTGDFTGHGLSASIGALPTSEIFYAMTAKGFGFVEILAEINSRLYRMLPTGMFLAATAIEISEDGNLARVWSGGAPDLLLRRREGKGVVNIQSRHFPLGIVDSSDMDKEVDVVSLAGGDRLYMYTDGVTEMVNPENVQFGMERLLGIIGHFPDDREVFETLLAELERFRAGQAQEDDVTLLEFICGTHENDMLQAQDAEPNPARVDSVTWQVKLEFEVDALRRMDPIPVVIQLLMEIQGLYAHREKVYTILAELFNNALEHGLLKLDSAIKESPEGFGRYYQQLERRLANLASGCISIALDHKPTVNGGRLGIHISDTGQGFDGFAQHKPGPAGNEYSGRGIGLVRSLCAELEYRPPGNQVHAVYAWTN